MGFVDSTSSVVTCILTRKGRELLAKNDGSFRITKFAFGDDEINYQLYNLATDDDSDILNLPILEPSSNEDSALRYRLVTLPKGSVAVATLSVNPTNLFLAFLGSTAGLSQGVVTVQTNGGVDNSYTVISRNTNIATATAGISTTVSNNQSTGLISVQAVATSEASTTIDVVGNDTGAMATFIVNIVGSLV